MAFALRPFGLVPFGLIGRRTEIITYSWLDALGSWLYESTSTPIYAFEYPQKIGLGDCARWRLVSQDRAGDIAGTPLKATTTTIEIDSRSLVKKNAYNLDRNIMNAIDRQVVRWKGHRIVGVLHEDVTTEREDLGGRWLYTYTSRYLINHYL